MRGQRWLLGVVTLVKDLVSGEYDFSPSLDDSAQRESHGFLVQSGLLFRIKVSARLNRADMEFHSRCFTLNPKGAGETDTFLRLAQDLGKELQRKRLNWTEEYFGKPQPPGDSDTFWKHFREYKRKLENFAHASRQDTEEYMRLIQRR